MKRYVYVVGGQVQGVGFRPFVYRTARRFSLSGHVGNTSEGVEIAVQGTESNLARFETALLHELPPLARIATLHKENRPLLPHTAEPEFTIVSSKGHHGHAVLVSPDVATCNHCLADIRDPSNRRYRYPFTNCTDCGPRYTITRSIPYDRAVTSMSCFPLCPECADEYTDPMNRRFHAQPNACPVCGPHIWLADRNGTPISGPSTDSRTMCGPMTDKNTQEQTTAWEVLNQLATRLAAGDIAAVKGLGGFHLVCSAVKGEGDSAITVLRQRKNRPHKSLAIMFPDLASARRATIISEAEETVLESPEHPIVSVQRLPGILPDNLAPDLPDIGIMLPYTPLHYLLLEAFADKISGIPALVMTSGNAGGDPIALGNREALQRLSGIADCFLFHNRDILIRADDSVVRVATCHKSSKHITPRQTPTPESVSVQTECIHFTPACRQLPLLHFFRRARGFVPRPLPLPNSGSAKSPTPLLATGAELKNTLCLTRDNLAFVSQHIGDLKNPETFAFFQEIAEHLAGLLEIQPEAIVCDLHPDYLSTLYARESGLPFLQLQHHFAHIYAVLAEHKHEAPALGLALDGTGYGLDGTIWGGELLYVHPAEIHDSKSFGQRLGRLSPFPLPGGEAAIREPWRIAASLVGLSDDTNLVEQFAEHGPSLFACKQSPGFNPRILPALLEMTQHGLAVQTSSCGRLFDAVAALLGLCPVITYEGQAAIRLETEQSKGSREPIEKMSSPHGFGHLFSVSRKEGLWELDVATGFCRLFRHRLEGIPVPVLARHFHNELAEGLADLTLRAANETGVRTVALAGGVLNNRTLARLLPEALTRRGLQPLLHHALPPGDGSISYGQAAWATRIIG